MRVKDLKEYLTKYAVSDDTIIDGVMFVDIMPSYYDGYPTEITDWNIEYRNEQKLRIYTYGTEDAIYDSLPSTQDIDIDEWISKIRTRISFDPTLNPIKIKDYKAGVEATFRRVAFEYGLDVTERHLWDD